MDDPTKEQYEQRLAELTSFCFRKLANVEARLIALCDRAEAVGIDCSDLRTPEPPVDEAKLRLSVLN